MTWRPDWIFVSDVAGRGGGTASAHWEGFHRREIAALLKCRRVLLRRAVQPALGMPVGHAVDLGDGWNGGSSNVMVLRPAWGRCGGHASAALLRRKGRSGVRWTLRRRWPDLWPPHSSWPDALGLTRCRGTAEQEQQTGSSHVLALGGMPQAEVADLVQAFRQDVLQEPAHELMAGDAAGPPSVRLPMLVADRDGLVVDADDAGVGDGNPEHIAGEVVERGLLAASPDRAMDDPGLGPCGLGQDEIGTVRLERGPELARTSLAEVLTGTRKALRAGCQDAPSSEMPPPVTRQWTCG